MDQLNIFVTGATSGIGLGIARHLAGEGHHISFNGLADASTVTSIKGELEAAGAASVRYYDADMRKADEIRAMMTAAEADMGRIDGLVNNAGIQFVAPIEEFPPEKWDEVIAINLSAAFHTIAVALPGMKSRGFGRIVNIASVHGVVGSAGKVAYTAAKHGLVGLTRTIALEAATDGVTCNAICPGWVRTPLVEAQIEARMAAKGTSRDDEARDLVIERQPTGEFVTIEQIAALVSYLMGPHAAPITGTPLTIDGAFTAW